MNAGFEIPRPCHKMWGELSGGDQKRFCDECGRHVHAIGRYEKEEWDRIWSESGDQVCGLLEGDASSEPRSRRAILVGAFLTTISPLLAQTGRVRIRVTDPVGAIVPFAEVRLIGSDGKIARTQRADEVGESAWIDLPLGDNKFSVFVPGFKIATLIATAGNEESTLEADLEICSGVVPYAYKPTGPVESDSTPEPVSKASKSKRRRWWIFR